jgi:hypothetical protein
VWGRVCEWGCVSEWASEIVWGSRRVIVSASGLVYMSEGVSVWVKLVDWFDWLIDWLMVHDQLFTVLTEKTVCRRQLPPTPTQNDKLSAPNSIAHANSTGDNQGKISLYVCLSVCLSICLSFCRVCLFVCLVCLCLSVLSVYLSVLSSSSLLLCLNMSVLVANQRWGRLSLHRWNNLFSKRFSRLSHQRRHPTPRYKIQQHNLFTNIYKNNKTTHAQTT